MAKGSYSRNEVREKCDEFLDKDPKAFYKEGFIMSIDDVKGEDGSERTEIIAERLNERIEDLKKIIVVERENYKVITHDGELTDSNQEEKNLAKKLFNQSNPKDRKKRTVFDFIGAIVDYETPLKSSNSDKGVGKIDLLSVADDEPKPSIFILELKKKNSSESMLRCVLEAYTYSKQVNKPKLGESFGVLKDFDLKAAPLLYKGGKQWEEMQEINAGKKPQLKMLMEQLNIAGPFYYVENPDGTFVITDR